MIYLIMFVVFGFIGLALFAFSVLYGSSNDFLRNEQRQKQVVWLILLSFASLLMSFAFFVTFAIDIIAKML